MSGPPPIRSMKLTSRLAGGIPFRSVPLARQVKKVHLFRARGAAYLAARWM
jgi:hypothetical protein